MALEDILGAIREEAEAEARRIVEEARHRGAALLADARLQAEAEADRLSHGRDDAAEVAARRITSRAHLETARARRTARESVYGEALARASTQLADLRARDGYEEVLGRLIDEAFAVLPDAAVAQVDPSDVELARRRIAALGSSARVEPAAVAWGGIVLSSDGRTVQNDLCSRLQRADYHLRFIAGDMFPPLRGGVG